MAIVAAPEFTLAAAVASPAGTVTLGYPTGTTQASFTGANALATAYLLLNDNDRYEEVDDEFDIAYGASLITITNKTGYSWPAGTRVRAGLARVASSNYSGPVASAITNPTGGSTIDAEGRAATVSILNALRAAGIVAS